MAKKRSQLVPGRGTNPDGSKAERRKSHRFPVSIPMEASWRRSDGTTIKAEASAKQVNSQGGLLQMETYPEMGSRITLINLISAETAEARVLATPSSREGVSDGIIVELTMPSETFWGVSFLAKKAGVELQKLESSLQSGGIELRLLKEFRDAVDYVRMAAAAVQELRERQLQGRGEEEILNLLAVERMRRASTLCQEVIVDIDAGKVTSETKGVENFQHALDQASGRLRPLFRKQEAGRSAGTSK